MAAALTYVWDAIAWKDIPKQTHSLFLDLLPESPGETKLQRLLTAVPHLTRLTGRLGDRWNGKVLSKNDKHYRMYRDGCYYPREEAGIRPDWTALGMGLRSTPQLNYLHLCAMKLQDVELLAILQGCSLQLCELHVCHNRLQFALPELIERLSCFTQLQ
mgnify:CR=1 FL=1